MSESDGQKMIAAAAAATTKKKYYKRKKRILEMFTIYYSLQGEECIMGMKRVFQKLKASVRCVKARDQYNFQMSESCPCTEADFEWWVCGSAAPLFTSLNPKHNILSAPPGHSPPQTSAQHEGCLRSAVILTLLSTYFIDNDEAILGWKHAGWKQ